MRKPVTIFLATLLTLMPLTVSRLNVAFAWYNTPVKYEKLYDVAILGATTQYGYIGPSGDRYPQFYSALIADGAPGTIYGFVYPELVKIEVSGKDSLGNPLAGDRFTSLSVLLSPDDSNVEQLILTTIYDVIVDLAPSGLKAIVKNTLTSGGATTGWDESKAWGVWQRPWYALVREERGLRFGYQLVVDPAIEGTYTINIHYHAWICAYDGVTSHHLGFIDLYDTITYEYVNTPNVPSKPSGPTSGYRGISYSYSTSAIDPNGDSIRYEFDWGDGTTYLTDWYASGATASASHIWSSLGTFNVKVRAQDATGAWSAWSSPLTVTILNRPPNTPSIPSGPTSGYTWETYVYTTVATDLDGDELRYMFDWGDGSTTITGWYASGATAIAAHHWTSTGTYYVKVQAQDTNGVWSSWSSSLAVTIRSGCPTLFSWNGTCYVKEALLDIHASQDLTVDYTLKYLKPAGNLCMLSLRELDNYTSHIDYVKLYAVDAEGNWHECSLTLALHNKLGLITTQLSLDDDTRIDLTPSQRIELLFTLPKDINNIQYFIFELNGYNPKPE